MTEAAWDHAQRIAGAVGWFTLTAEERRVTLAALEAADKFGPDGGVIESVINKIGAADKEPA